MLFKFNPFGVSCPLCFANPELHSGLLKFKPFGLYTICINIYTYKWMCPPTYKIERMITQTRSLVPRDDCDIWITNLMFIGVSPTTETTERIITQTRFTYGWVSPPTEILERMITPTRFLFRML